MRQNRGLVYLCLLGISLTLSACGGGGGGGAAPVNTYMVGGTVTGLAGTGLTLQNNGGDDLAISADGSFTFATALNDLSSYAVTVSSQPGTPGQTCVVSNGSSTLAGADVTNVAVACTNNTYTIGGMATGLSGSGLVLQNNAGDDLAINVNGSFTFATALTDLSSYAVTVLTNPSTPNQICSVSSGSGALAGANVTNVAVTCSTNPYTVSGTVTGLAVSNSLVLRNNGGDNQTVSGSSFTFTAQPDGSPYLVSVLTQPTTPNQTCAVTANGSGTLAGADVTNVAIVCVTNTYTIGGMVTGLAGTGLVLQNNGGDNLAISGNGSFTFATAQPDGNTYAVTVQAQPGTPTQVCTIGNGSGSLSGSNVTTVAVTCSTSTYTVGGTISGLSGSGLVLQNNGGDNLAISANGSFTFASALADLSGYTVTVLAEPGAPNQTCAVTANGSGTLAGANIINVAVTCTTNTYTIGVTVTSLSGSGLVLQNNLGNDLPVSADGSYTFTTALDDQSSYSVTVLTQPGTPSQLCSVSNATGTLAGVNITNVSINCTTNSYTVGGSVTGLSGSGLVLQNNAGGNLAVSANGSFTFSASLVDLSNYAVTVLTQPGTPTQICSVTSGSGSLAGANVTNVAISCASSYTIGGSVSGLAGSGLVLQNNAGDDLAVSADGGFTFTTALIDLSSYAVTVLTQPTNLTQVCTVSSGSGTLASADITNVAVTCVSSPFTIGGSVSGLTGAGLVLQNNGGDDKSISADGNFTFTTAIADGSSYAVTVLTQPNTPSQSCDISNRIGTLAGANVTNVTVTCRSWGTAGLVETNDGGTAEEPQVAFGPNGDAIAVWHQRSGPLGTDRTDIWYSLYTAGGAWSAAVRLETDDRGSASRPNIAFDDNGNAMAVWRQYGRVPLTQQAIMSRYYTAGGGGWGTAVEIETLTSGQYADPSVAPQIAFDSSGNAFAVWGFYDGTRYNIRSNRYAAGSGWGTAVLLETDNTSFARYPHVAVDSSGNAMAVWEQSNGTWRSIWSNYYTGGSWNGAVLVETEELGHARSARVAFDSLGDAFVVWEQDDGTTNFSIKSNIYSLGVWGMPALVETTLNRAAFNPQIVIDSNDEALVVWYMYDGTQFGVWSNRYTAGWGTPEPIESMAGDVKDPQIALDANDNALAVWHQTDGTRNSIWSNRYTVGSGWGTAELIETTDLGDALNPQIAIDPLGDALSVWYQCSSPLCPSSAGTDRADIWFNRLQ